MQNKNGFTLMEILLAMGIVMTVTLMLMAGIKNIKPDRNVVMFKKAYSIISRNISEMVNDDDLYPENEDSNTEQYFGNTDNVSYKNKNYGGDTKFCEIFASKMNLSSDVDCTAKDFEDGVISQGQFKTADGMVWILPISDFASESDYYSIYVDVNGDNDPNCGYSADNCPMPDRFQVEFRQDGKMRLQGVKEIEYVSSGSMTN